MKFTKQGCSSLKSYMRGSFIRVLLLFKDTQQSDVSTQIYKHDSFIMHYKIQQSSKASKIIRNESFFLTHLTHTDSEKLPAKAN